MAVTITIAGVDRTADIKLESFGITQVLDDEQDTCSFTVKSGDKPVEGQEIIVEDGGVRLFAGIITAPKDVPKAPHITWYSVEAVDYGYMLNRRLVVETYRNMSASDIAIDIVGKYCPGFTTTGVQSGAPEVEKIVFDYTLPTDALKELADYVGWHYYIDYYKDVKFFSGYNSTAPMEITPSAPARKLKHDIDIQGLRNRVYVRGGTMLSDPWTYEVKADGSARAWVLPHKPYDISLTVGGAVKTVGEENVNDEASYDYMVNLQEKYVRCSSHTTTPSAGATMSFTYEYEIDVITMVEDLVSQQTIADIQGGDGIYEHVIVDDSLTTIDAAEAAGLADLREHANPRVKGSFETEISGWAPGQLVTIDLSERGITGTYLVQKVTITPATPDLWTYQVEFGGRLSGIADWLTALYKAQQKKKLNETAILHRFTRDQETVEVSDEFTTTPRTPPWYCGETDAICGFVECAGFFQIVAADGIGILTGCEGPAF